MRYVYVIQNLIDGKVYVGQTKNPTARKATHFYHARRGVTRPLYASIRKHGEENFTFKILEECDDLSVNDREQHWVSHFDSFNPEKGYNLTRGGNQMLTFTDDVRQRMRQHHTGMTGRHHTEETKKRISDTRKRLGLKPSERAREKSRQRASAQRGELHPMFGRRGEDSPLFGHKHSEEAKQRMSEARKLYWERKRQQRKKY